MLPLRLPQYHSTGRRVIVCGDADLSGTEYIPLSTRYKDSLRGKLIFSIYTLEAVAAVIGLIMAFNNNLWAIYLLVAVVLSCVVLLAVADSIVAPLMIRRHCRKRCVCHVRGRLISFENLHDPKALPHRGNTSDSAEERRRQMGNFYPLWLVEYNGRKQLRVSDEKIQERFLRTEMKKIPHEADIWFDPVGADMIVKYAVKKKRSSDPKNDLYH